VAPTNANRVIGDDAARQDTVFAKDQSCLNSQSTHRKQALRAERTGTTCTAAGIAGRGTTPTLALCKGLIAAGLSPDQALEVYRGATLALRIRSIGEAAGLEINGEGNGFRPARKPDAAPPMRPNGKGGAS
jgi:hypothetical protein